MELEEIKNNFSLPQITFGPDETEKTLVIRYDDPKKVYDPEKVSIEGIITTPSEFVTKRGNLVDPKTSYVEFNKKALTITLTVDASDKFSTKVIGKLVRNPFLTSLNINSDTAFTIQSLRKLLKFQPIHFKDRGAHRAVIMALENFKFKVEKEVEEFNSREKKEKGQSVKKKIVEISDGIKFDFVLFTPLFLGGPKIEIPISVEIEPSDSGGVDLLLEYLDWEDVQEKEIESKFEEQAIFFEPFTIVFKD